MNRHALRNWLAALTFTCLTFVGHGSRAAEDKRFSPETEWIMAYSHTSTAPEIIGPTAEGLRFNIQVTSGQFRGDRLSGSFTPGGSARVLVRTDGVCTYSAHASGKTEDDALFLLEASGTCDLGLEGYKQFLAGTPPKVVKLWVVSKMHSAHPKYEWLNRRQFVQFGEIDMASGVVRYDVYALKKIVPRFDSYNGVRQIQSPPELKLASLRRMSVMG